MEGIAKLVVLFVMKISKPIGNLLFPVAAVEKANAEGDWSAAHAASKKLRRRLIVGTCIFGVLVLLSLRGGSRDNDGRDADASALTQTEKAVVGTWTKGDRPKRRSLNPEVLEARQRAEKALQLFELNKRLAAQGADYHSWSEDERTVGKLWKKAAALGDPEAQNAIGVAYADGKWGFPQDDEEACKWFAKSAKQENENAQFNLGVRYLSGSGVRRNEKEGVKWLRAAAQTGLSDAQYQLGLCLKNGIGAKKSDTRAVEWFKSAALSGHQKAQLELGKAYLSGIGGVKSPEDGVKWVIRCLNQESFFYPTDVSLEARAVLGLCYQYGLGKKQDADEASKQIELAERFGTDANLAELKKELHLK